MVLNAWRCTRILVLGAIVFCQAAMCRQTGNFEQLTLEITTSAQEVLPMEPMTITITLSNNTQRPITGHALIDPGYGILKVYVAQADKPFEQFHSSDRPTLTGIRGDDLLKPGFFTTFSGYLFYAHPANLDKEKRGQYLFESPGIYRIKATFDDINGESRIESNVLTVEAKQPSGEDAAAYRFLKELQDGQDKSVYYGNFLLRDLGGVMNVRDQKVLARQKEFVSRFPKSRYSRYLCYSLGLTYCRQKEEKDVRKGIDLLNKAAGYDDFFLAKEALLKLIETLEEQRKSDQAWKYKKVFARRFPDSEEGRDYVEEVYVASVEGRRLLWPLIPVVVAAGVFFFGLLPRLRRKPNTG